ncbi:MULTISPECIES: site-specific integrase [unclassified Carboxylicivirga]|uniref:site-specific integrase n=1 Tax=Carboxylicivirga TaxID=1628153 RepID=UPI003D337985
MRITTNFLLKTSKQKKDGSHPLYIRATLSGQRIELSTGIFIKAEFWDKDGQLVIGKHPDARLLNKQLNRITSKVHEVYYKLEALGDDFDISTIKEHLIGSSYYYLLDVFKLVIQTIEKKVGFGYANGTYKHYKTTLKRLQLFLKETKYQDDIPLHKIDYNFLNAFDTYLKVKHHVSDHSVSKYHKQLRKILNDAVAMNQLDKNPYSNFKIKHYKGKRDYLSLQEINTLETKIFDIERISVVRDIFIFACYTGLSYSDIASLSKSNLISGDDGELWIVVDRIKTGTRCRIPILPKAKAIIDKYQNHPVSNQKGKLLPINSNQKMNSYLKEIADICQIKKQLTMHVARHTFATSITLANGVPIETVSKMLGHTSLKTTQIYGKIIDSKISQDMKKLKTLL